MFLADLPAAGFAATFQAYSTDYSIGSIGFILIKMYLIHDLSLN